jgi:hypothetical protein
MPEWLRQAVQPPQQLAVADLAFRLVVASVLGGLVAGTYWLTQRREKAPAPGFLGTLVLLAVLIAMVTLVIGDNVARAFSLVGALAIVRFRTIVEDTRDTAFVIFAVVVGMAVGGGSVTIALVGFPVVAAAALLFRPGGVLRGPRPVEATLVLRLGLGHDPDTLLRDVFARHASRWRVIAGSTARQGAALDLTYSLRLRREDGMIAFVRDLNQVEGVQAVELRQN